MFSLHLSSVYTASRPFFASHPTHQGVGCVSTRSWEGTRARQLTPTDPRNIPGHMASCSVYKAGGRRKWGMSGVMVFVIPNHHYMWWSPAFLEMAEHLPAGGKWGVDPLLCFVCVQFFLYLLNHVYLKREFSPFPDSFLHPTVGE